MTAILPYLTHRGCIHTKQTGVDDAHGNATDSYVPVLDDPVYSVPAFVGNPSVDVVMRGEDEVHVVKRIVFLNFDAVVTDQDIFQWNDIAMVIKGILPLWDAGSLHHFELDVEELNFPGSARSMP